VQHFVSDFRIRLRIARRCYTPAFLRKAWFEFFPTTLHFGAEQGGFGVPVADILSAPSTPACALPGASMRRNYSCKAIALGCITATLRFESPNGSVIF